MSNIINTQNYISENPVYAAKISEENTTASRFSQAPVSIPKYSLNQSLKEKDEFRNSARMVYKENEQAKENMSLFKKICLLGAAIGAFIVLESKKII